MHQNRPKCVGCTDQLQLLPSRTASPIWPFQGRKSGQAPSGWGREAQKAGTLPKGVAFHLPNSSQSCGETPFSEQMSPSSRWTDWVLRSPTRNNWVEKRTPPLPTHSNYRSVESANLHVNVGVSLAHPIACNGAARLWIASTPTGYLPGGVGMSGWCFTFGSPWLVVAIEFHALDKNSAPNSQARYWATFASLAVGFPSHCACSAGSSARPAGINATSNPPWGNLGKA